MRMSDPYGHGDTCDCERCMAFSEGVEAERARRRSRPHPLQALPNLTKVTAFTRDGWNGIATALPPSGASYLVGLLFGLFEEEMAEEHLAAIDSLCRLAPAHATRLIGAQTRIVQYLRQHAIADYRPRAGFVKKRYPEGT